MHWIMRRKVASHVFSLLASVEGTTVCLEIPLQSPPPGDRHLVTVSPPHPGDRRALPRDFARGAGGTIRGRRLRCTHTMHSLTCMSVVVCVMRKPRPCNSYSRRRDRINSVLWRSYYKGGGVHMEPSPKQFAQPTNQCPFKQLGFLITISFCYSNDNGSTREPRLELVPVFIPRIEINLTSPPKVLMFPSLLFPTQCKIAARNMSVVF